MVILGDLHSNIAHLIYTLSRGILDNNSIIQVGDFGVGFIGYDRDLHNLKILDEALGIHKVKLYIVRGNHDDPSYFKGDRKNELNEILKNIIFVEDYEIHTIENKKVLFIGGAISIDRKMRVEGKSYWKDEGITVNNNKIKEIIKQEESIDILITHSAPDFCDPIGYTSSLVRMYKQNDSELIEDLREERQNLSKIFDELDEICKFKYHFYGHFHKNNHQKIVNCNHFLVNIGEFINLDKFIEKEKEILKEEKIRSKK